METKPETEPFPPAWNWKPTIRKLGNAWAEITTLWFRCRLALRHVTQSIPPPLTGDDRNEVLSLLSLPCD
jgi:hypothetical protein